MALTVGTPAPDFSLRTLNSEGLADIRLADYRGKNAVLLFFPAAFTGVCKDELCGVSTDKERYDALNAVAIGISADTAFAQAAWAEQSGITIPLASDYQHKTIQAYDVVLADLVGHGPGSERAVFIVDGEGIIRYVQVTANPGVAPDFAPVFEALEALA